MSRLNYSFSIKDSNDSDAVFALIPEISKLSYNCKETTPNFGIDLTLYLVTCRAATFTHVNDTVSCFCNKRLQNWPTIYTNFSV